MSYHARLTRDEAEHRPREAGPDHQLQPFNQVCLLNLKHYQRHRLHLHNHLNTTHQMSLNRQPQPFNFMSYQQVQRPLTTADNHHSRPHLHYRRNTIYHHSSNQLHNIRNKRSHSLHWNHNPRGSKTILPAKRPHQAMWITEEGVEMFPEGFDGSVPIGYGPKRQVFANAYRMKPEDESDTSAEFEGDYPTQTDQPRLSRQEQKQLDRELPWREEASWRELQSIQPVSNQEADQILNDKQARRRVIRSRAAFRDKNRGQGEIKAKARVVALGHCDPDIFKITRESPTPGRIAEHLAYAFIVAGANAEIGNSGKKWNSWLADASTAFLQGQQPDHERPAPLYMPRSSR